MVFILSLRLTDTFIYLVAYVNIQKGPIHEQNVKKNLLFFYFRNIVYNLSIHDFAEQQRLVWYSPEDDVKMCVVKGKDEVSNYF